MSAKKAADGSDELDPEKAPEEHHPEPAPQAEAPRKPEPKPAGRPKPAPEPRSGSAEKPAETKTLAEIMKFDLKIRRPRR